MSWPFLAGEKPAAEKLGAGPNTYNPALTADTTNPNLGAEGSASGGYVRVGPNYVSGWASFVLDGSGASSGSGALSISLPLPADISFMLVGGATTGAWSIGTGWARSSTGSSSVLFDAHITTATTVQLMQNASSGRISQPGAGAWTTIRLEFAYVIETGT